jgi:hypothetical protein
MKMAVTQKQVQQLREWAAEVERDDMDFAQEVYEVLESFDGTEIELDADLAEQFAELL